MASNTTSTASARGAPRGDRLSVAGIGSLLTTGIAPGLNLLIDPGNGPDIVITALSALTDVKVISSPQVVVQDNRTALLKVGDQVPVTVQQAVSVQAPMLRWSTASSTWIPVSSCG